MSVNLVAIAAFSAAGLSLVNVAVSARLASRGTRDQWRREQERPIVARILTLSSDAMKEWAEIGTNAEMLKSMGEVAEMARALRADAAEHWAKGAGALESLRYELAQLDLVANDAVRSAAHSLFEAHDVMKANMNPDLAGPQQPPAQSPSVFRTLDNQLINATRSDLSVDHYRHRLLRSFRIRRARSQLDQALMKAVGRK